MKLIKKNLHTCKVKSHAVNQLTFDEDYNVPDTKADIGRMIQRKCRIDVEEVKVTEGQSLIRGRLIADLLYVVDGRGGEVAHLEIPLPFAETLQIHGLTDGDKICLKWDVEDLSMMLIHSRKVGVKALVTFTACVEELVDIPLPVGLEDAEELSEKKKQVRLLELGVHKKDTMRIRETLTLPSNKPNINEILWETMEIRGTDIRALDGKLSVKGELFAFLLYTGADDSGAMQWMEYAVPFARELECPGAQEDMAPNVAIQLLSGNMEVKPDADGEERLIQADAVLELTIKLYSDEEESVLLDIYTPLRECVPVRREETIENLLVRNFSKCRLNERIEVPADHGKILQICHSDGSVKVDHAQIVENGIAVDGIVQLKILYIVGDDEMPFYSTDVVLPFHHVVEAVGIYPACGQHLRTDLEQLSTSMADSNEIEVKVVISLNALVLGREKLEVIQEIEERPLDREKLQQMPGIVGYLAQEKDTLWDIAKEYGATVEDIRELNDLGDEDIRAGEFLLLVKKVQS